MKSFSHRFISSPRLAWVIAIVILLCGALCLSRMPVSEYPNIIPVKRAEKKLPAEVVKSGIVVKTVVGILFVPALYCIVERIREALTGKRGPRAR